MKIKFFLLFIVLSSCTQSQSEMVEMQYDRFATAFTAGYVFKHSDRIFKKVYGRGMGNIITGDFCYYPSECWGLGGKVSYWLALGKTTFFKRHTRLQEVPITIYARRLFEFKKGLQLYASLGAGIAWMGEKSYLGHQSRWKGIGEVEAGLNYPAWCRLDFTSAFRYIFPRQSQKYPLLHYKKMDVGGFDLRAGVGFSF